MEPKLVHIFGGGTVSYIGSHLAVCAPAYGRTAWILNDYCEDIFDKMNICVNMTKMAHGDMETNEDVEARLDEVIADPNTKVVFMTCALVDFGYGGDKYGKRLSAKDGPITINLEPMPKLITKIRKKRKDIFLVAFKQTCGLSEQEQYLKGLELCKQASANLVLANDTKTRLNMIITPEEAKYHVTTNRHEALRNLVEMTKLRSHLTFTRSTVISGNPIPWDSPYIFPALRTVVDYCISQGAYKPFAGATVGHFACKLDENTFLTSIRRSNFNDLSKVGLVKIVTDGPDSVLAYGAKPSVGGQSQRIVFNEHKSYDCIVHFHCPIKEGSLVPTVSQREYECGSHQCGQNTSTNLKRFGNLSCVYLDQHGPNIVFNHDINPQEVIDFINANFDLADKTGGPVSLKEKLETPSTLETAEFVL